MNCGTLPTSPCFARGLWEKIPTIRNQAFKRFPVFSVHADLMNNTFSSVWLECGLLVCNIYHQWHLPKQGNDKTSATVNSRLERFSRKVLDSAICNLTHMQLERFVIFLDQW
jgi:hypothetical protein